MSNRRAASADREPRRSRFVFLLSMLAIVTSLLMPVITLTASDAAAQGVPPDCDPGYVEVNGECVLDQGQNGTETATSTVTETATLPQVDPAYVFVEKYECPPTQDWSGYNDPVALFNDGCGLNQTPVTMTVNGQPQQITSQGQWGPFEGINQVQVGEEVPNGYNLPLWFCGTYPANGQPQGFSFLGASASVAPGLAPGEWLACVVFNHQPPTEQYGTVILHKIACPDGYTFTDPYQATIEQLQQECQQPLGGVSFNYEQNGQPVQQLVTDQSGMAQWDQAPVGPYTLREQLPPGYAYAVVHCSYHEANQGNFAGQSSPVSMNDPSSWGGTMEAGYVLECYVFNFLPENENTVTIYKWLCEPGTQYGQDMAYYQGQDGDPGPCEQEHLNIPIHLIHGGPQQDTTTQANGTQFENVVLDQGSFQIWIEEPQGYGEPMVWCWPVEGEPGGQPYPTQGGTWTVTPGTEPFSWQCNVYDIPTDTGAGQIVVEKYWCPPVVNFVQTPTRADMMAACQEEPGTGANFTLDGPSGAAQMWPEWQPSGPAPQSNTWTDLPPGEYTIVENGLAGWTSTVYCHASSGEANDVADDMLQGPSVVRTLEAGYTIDCAWFNHPPDGEYNYVDFYKYVCDFDAPKDQDKTWYEQNCTPVADWEFNLTWTGGGSAQSTDQSGYASWSGLPTGTWQAQETVPEGYGEPIVWCRYVEWPDEAGVTGDWARFDAPGGAYENGFGYEGMRIECHWYNFAPDDYNYLDVYKYYCQGPVPEGADKTWYEQNCDPVAQWDFQLSWISSDIADPPSSTETTDETGKASWSGLPTGTWQVTEFLPDSYLPPVVYCRYVEWPDEAGVTGDWAQFDAPEGVYSNGFGYDGMRMECHWYNIGGGEYNYVDLYKYECLEAAPEGADQSWYEQNCTPVDGWNFNVGWDGGGSSKATDANGFAGWSGVPTGGWNMSETVPEGYGEPVIWCRYIEWPEGSGANGDWTMYTPVEGYYESTFGEGEWRIECYWYNFPPENENTVTIYKWLCEPGTQYGQDMAYYQGQDGDPGPCEQEHLNIPIHLIHGGPQQDTTTQANGTQFENVVLDQGSFQIWIEEPQGYGEPMVWCWPVEGDPGGQPYPTQGGTWTVTPGTEPFSWQCNVYDIPAPEYRVELYKYTCLYTVDRTLGLPDLGSNPDCTPTQGVSFTASFGGNPGSAYYTDANGYINWQGVESGPWSLTEGAKSGYAMPKVYCGAPQSAETPEVPVSMNWTVTGTLSETTPHIICYWFNFEEETENGRITVYKYQCPPGTTATDFGLLSESCVTPHNGIGFNLSGNGVNSSASTVAGTVDWTNLEQGAYTVTETTVLPGYLAPVVYCGIVVQDGAPIDPGSVQWLNQPVTNQSIQLTLDNLPKRIVCYWYNIPSDYGEITIYKWTCPEGYDLDAWGADPKVDCTQATNGVTFTLTPPVGPALQSNTGDSIAGAVYFGGLEPGAYTVTETVPPDTSYVFVLDCTGTDIPKVHQYPLSWGNKLDINVAGGDQIVCHWYNVPRPEKGWVTVTKYMCSTKTWVDKVYCTVYEKGQSVELVQVNGNVSKGVGITNSGGTYTWNNLDPGAYTVKEQGMVPCKMTASMVDGKGNAQVAAGKGTMVNIYNCSSTPGKVPPGKVPTKYPNTGVPPEGVDSLMPAMQGEAASTPSPEDEAASEAFYQVDCVSGSVAEGTPVPSTPAADATMPPIEAEPTEAPVDAATTPEPPATPEVGEGECVRGAIPQHLTIESIGVDADFEYLEIIDGLMEQPTGADDVAWYKDTARLGENNNVVVAGHLNWWNVPEGVFYRLQDMQEGDLIQVAGDDGQVYTYEVRSVTQESNLEEPGVDVIGPTDEPTLTLITCGGDWNADIAEYDERTVVRAVQVDVQPAETDAG